MSQIMKSLSRRIGLHKKLGLPPGTVIHVGERKAEKTKVTLIEFDEKKFAQRDIQDIETCFPLRGRPTISWINVDGLHDVDIIEKIGSHLNIHPLVLEDIVHTGQRPKTEDFGDYVFVVLKMLSYDEAKDEVKGEQVSMILGPHYVISFQEQEGDVFTPIRQRIQNGKGRIKKAEGDYLAYCLVDAIVDHYFFILERMGEKLESVEDELITRSTPATLQMIHTLKGDLIFLRKAVWPLREVINGLERGESSIITKTTRIYLRDVYDHTIQVIDTIETSRDIVSGMLDIYLSSLSHRMNEVMKVLTIIATVFIPLTFIAGVYGMNFKYMPELKWRAGYPLVLLVMVGLAVSMVVYFWRKKWL